MAVLGVSTVPTVLVNAPVLERFCLEAALALGFGDEDAALFTAGLLGGSLRTLPGQGQGIQSLPKYADRVRRGVIDAGAQLEQVGGHGAMAVLDAHRAAGGIAAARGMELAVALAGTHGIGAVAVRDSTHLGAAGHFAELAIPHDCIGLVFTNAGPEIAPWGGTRATLGTNPWAVAAPTGLGFPIVLDMANSTSGKGMMLWHQLAGAAIPDDWALTADGARTTDAAAGIAGTLFPLGGPKGVAMALVVDLLTGALSGSAVGRDCFADEHQDVGHLLLALDLEAFGPLDAFLERADRLVAQVRDSPTATDDAELLVPGELEHRRRQERLLHGIPLLPDRREGLVTLGHELGLGPDVIRPVQEAR